MPRRRKMDDCEPLVEKFLSETERFKEWKDGFFVTWCRMGNGGDPPHHTGPFREDQLYLNFEELITVYPQAGLAILSTEGMDSNDLFYPVIFGALLAFKCSDEFDPGWMYTESGWNRLGQTEEGNVSVKQNPVQEIVRIESEENTEKSPNPDYMDMLFFVDDYEGTVVTICPAKFFQEFGHCADSAYQLEFDEAMKGLEDDFFEITDATYEFSGSVEEATQILLKRGFRKDPNFDEFMKRSNAFSSTGTGPEQ